MARLNAASSLLSLWAAVVLRSPANGCQETAWPNGRLEDAAQIGLFTVASDRGGSCACCGLCHQHPACASLSYATGSNECRLFDSVASYATLTSVSQQDMKYLVMPNRSQHEQFCRDDSDCVEPGDACRGRVCTEREAVTCRAIHEFGAAKKYGVRLNDAYGWLNNQPLSLSCFMGNVAGSTRLFYTQRDFQFDRQTIQEYNADVALFWQPYSILRLADDIRRTRNADTYKLTVYAPGYFLIKFYAPRSEPVIAGQSRYGDDTITIDTGNWNADFPISMPYWTSSGPTLLTMHDSEQEDKGSLARSDGYLEWGTLELFIEE